MSQKVYFAVKSKEKCQKCKRLIKENLVHRKPTKRGSLFCYKCWRELQHMPMRTAREIRRHPELRSLSRDHIPLH